MDPENQDRIKSLVDEHGADDLVVVLGAADLEALEVAAETVTLGDPAYVGPLAGVQLGLPVMHILEDDVRQNVDPAVWDEQVGLLEMTLDVDQIKRAAASFPGRDGG
jgi:glycine/sarcosine/betaine reductase complex component A